ncbi:hypothetical protein G9A89_014806 [Geosiphon pyriformis]|nr:hypothetical protein G9A89_014806 [Geosiphon pyriformis]
MIDFSSSGALLNNRVSVSSSISKRNIAAKDSFSMTVAGGILSSLMLFELGLMVVFELQVFDKLFVAVAVDILLVAAVDKLEVDIQMVDILAVVSLANKSVNMLLSLIDNLELETCDWNFNIDFPIVSFLFLTNNQFSNVFVYHSSGRYMFLAATADWIIMRNATDFVDNL